MTTEKQYRCRVCGKMTTGRRPRIARSKTEAASEALSQAYNADFHYPHKHKDKSGAVCKGSFMEAELVTSS